MQNFTMSVLRNVKLKAFALALLFALISVDTAFATSTTSQTNYELKEVVVLSRHNIRAPLSSKNSVLSRVTTHQWTDWTANASELTLRGGALETMMGQYFRKWLESEGLFEDAYCPNKDEVNIYANSMQRTIATANYFAAGLLPTCDIPVYHRFEPSKMDPVFFPRLTKVTEDFKEQAVREVAAMGGKKGFVGINEGLKDSYATIKKVLDLKNSPAAKSGELTDFFMDDTEMILELGQEPNIKGSLKIATTISDALILQYFEVANDLVAAFGNKLSQKDWENISKVKDVYGDVLFSAPIVAVNVANPLLRYMKDELESNVRKFTFLVGHDSNISSVTSALQFEAYTLPNTIEKKTPIGSKLVFEKWLDKSTNTEVIKINMVYQNTDQLRHLQPLDLNNTPCVVPLKLAGIQANEDGFYKFEDVIERFNEALRAYELIK